MPKAQGCCVRVIRLTSFPSSGPTEAHAAITHALVPAPTADAPGAIPIARSTVVAGATAIRRCLTDAGMSATGCVKTKILRWFEFNNSFFS